METVGFSLAQDDGAVVLVEMMTQDTDDDLGGMERAGLRDRVCSTAEVTFERALGTIGPVVRAVRAQVDALENPPDDVEVSFGLKLTGTSTAKIVSAAGESHLNLTMRWSQRPE